MFNKTIPVIVTLFLFGLLLLASCEPSTPESTVEPAASPEAQQPDEDSTSRSPSERVPRITVEELFQKIDREENILIVDTRADVETSFEEGHIKGAVPVPLAQILDKRWVPPSDIEIILYCTWPNEKTSARAALELIDQGFSKVAALKGGYEAWLDAGYPIETGAAVAE